MTRRKQFHSDCISFDNIRLVRQGVRTNYAFGFRRSALKAIDAANELISPRVKSTIIDGESEENYYLH